MPSHHRIGTDAINHATATDQTKLTVKDCGAGRPAILMHGWAGSADSWDDLAAVAEQTGARCAVLAGVSVDAGEVARCHVD